MTDTVEDAIRVLVSLRKIHMKAYKTRQDKRAYSALSQRWRAYPASIRKAAHAIITGGSNSPY